MKSTNIIPYFHTVPWSAVPEGACLRLSGAEEGAFPNLEGKESVWLESPDPGAALAAAAWVRRPVLNSLSADERSWLAIGADEGTLRRFDRVVLLPFVPGATTQDFDANVDAVLSLADKYELPPERRIVDVCILPRRTEPDPDVYASRIAYLRERGYDACGGVNNFVYADDERRLPAFWARLEAAGLAYGLVSARLAHMAGDAND